MSTTTISERSACGDTKLSIWQNAALAAGALLLGAAVALCRCSAVQQPTAHVAKQSARQKAEESYRARVREYEGAFGDSLGNVLIWSIAIPVLLLGLAMSKSAGHWIAFWMLAICAFVVVSTLWAEANRLLRLRRAIRQMRSRLAAA